MSNNIRIRTTPNGTDKYLNVKLEQDFDFIEILSLKISQDNAYEKFCSDYGVIVGRVIVNSGFGVPNAKVSVFIPISEEDKFNPVISGVYPFETVNDVDIDGVRYNLLPKENDSQNECYTPVGTLSSKREFLDNDEMLEVYCKYYKFTTTTNYAGDFMIFGVPLGTHIVHVDADISNIGIASQRPYDLIEQGTPTKFFDSPTKFKRSKNLNSLIQIKTINSAVNVKPFWGDTDNCIIGINRLDIDLNYNIRPSAIFMGSVFGDSNKNSVNKRCRPRKGLGKMCEQISREGTIEMIRKTIDNQVERYDVEGGRVIDSDGAWAYQIPMNLDYMVTDENGDLIPTDDVNRGVPTRARVRFRVGMDEGGNVGRIRTRGKYLIPHNPSTKGDMDFSFDASTPDNTNNFRDIYWNKIYTVKNFIGRTERDRFSLEKSHKIEAFTGIKDVDGCVGDKNPFPFNRAAVKGNVLFSLLCFIFSLIANLVFVINKVFCFLSNISIFGLKPFGWVKNFIIPLVCPNDDESRFYVGCNDRVSDFLDCIKAVLVDQLNLYQLDFYNDWVNGSLYYYLLKYKKTRRGKEKFCETNCTEYSGGTGYNKCKSNKIKDTTYGDRNDTITQSYRNGLMVKYDGNLYYPPMVLNGKNLKLFPADLVNLGSVFDCDWQGLPKIVQYLNESSYNIPPLIAESFQDEEEEDITEQTVVAGMFDSRYGEGLFFDIGCIEGVTHNSLQARNIRRISELSVDIPESQPPAFPRAYVGINEIYDTSDPIDTLNSINRYVRDSFYGLNVNGPSSPMYLSGAELQALTVPSNGTSFHIDDTLVNGSAYNDFRGWAFPINAPDMSMQTENSYYLYFGITPGKTALDKLNSKFFTTCFDSTKIEFIIDSTSQSTSMEGLSDGSIYFSIVGGVGPFTYQLEGVDVSYDLEPVTLANNATDGLITGLTVGEYILIVTDSLGTTTIKKIAVDNAPSLSCSVTISNHPSSQTSLDGAVELTQVVGGKQPYQLKVFDSNNNLLVTYDPPIIGQVITGLISGIYTFTTTDAVGASCTKTIELIGRPALNILNVVTLGSCTNCDGEMNFQVAGGTAPYQIIVSGQSGVVTGSTPTSYSNLCSGTFTVKISDSGQPQHQTIQENITINGGLVITKIASVLIDGNYIVTFKVTGGTSPYEVFVANNKLLPTNLNPYTYQYTTPNAFEVDVYDNSGCNKTQLING